VLPEEKQKGAEMMEMEMEMESHQEPRDSGSAAPRGGGAAPLLGYRMMGWRAITHRKNPKISIL